MSSPVIPLASFPRIFDRRRKDHPWAPALEELSRDPELTRRCVVENWRMDPRVSKEREEDVLAFPGWVVPASGSDWFSKLRGYFEQRLCQPIESVAGGSVAATLEPKNASNEIAPLAVPPHEQLLHAGCLNNLLRFLQTGAAPAAAARLKLEFTTLTGRPFPDPPVGGAGSWERFQKQVDEVALSVNDKGVAAVQALGEALSNALQPTEPLWWATFAQEVQPLVEAEDGLGLGHALGLGHLMEGQWLILWRYEVRILSQRVAPGRPVLFRPTVGEALANPFHFPSPPGHPYGITMPLATSPGAYREVLHRPLVGAAAATCCTGKLLRLAGSPVDDHAKLASLRQRHRRRLERQLPMGDTRKWLERHTAVT